METFTADSELAGLVVLVLVILALAILFVLSAVFLVMLRWAIRMWWQSRFVLAAVTLVVLWSRFGTLVALLFAAALVLLLVVWRLVACASFDRIVVWPIRFGRRRAWYRRNWEPLMEGHRLSRKRRGKRVYPRLAFRIRCGPWIDRLTVRPLVGQSIADFEAAAEALAMAMGARECRVAVDRPGVLRVEVLWADALETLVQPVELGRAVDLARVPVGIGEDGGVWTVRLAGNHVLVVGVTDAGKSSVVWSIVRGIAPAVRDGVVELWAVDPKGGMELLPGRSLFAQFSASGVVQMVELLEAAVLTMQERAARFAGQRRKHSPTVDDPLIVVLVDEVAFLTAYVGDSRLRGRASNALAVLLTQGRAVGVCVVAALQDPRKEVLGFRNLFPTKVALRLDERTQVDMVLGDGARAAGARCDQLSPSTPGVGYVKVDGVREPRRVRAAYVTDDEIALIAQHFAPGLRVVA